MSEYLEYSLQYVFAIVFLGGSFHHQAQGVNFCGSSQVSYQLRLFTHKTLTGSPCEKSNPTNPYRPPQEAFKIG